jgi:hypothetical protein
MFTSLGIHKNCYPERNAESRVDMVVTKEENTYGGVDTVR